MVHGKLATNFQELSLGVGKYLLVADRPTLNTQIVVFFFPSQEFPAEKKTVKHIYSTNIQVISQFR